tara:strand:+ start:3385 stop:3507 length:123 start_codon:yes stop_codon:yes gene_type:complete
MMERYDELKRRLRLYPIGDLVVLEEAIKDVMEEKERIINK